MIKLITEERIDFKDTFTLQVLNLPIECYVDLQIELRKLVLASIRLSFNQCNGSAMMSFAIYGQSKH